MTSQIFEAHAARLVWFPNPKAGTVPPSMSEDLPPPEAIGKANVRVAVAKAGDQPPNGASQAIRAGIVGLLFSVVPIILTNLVLTRGQPGFHPTSLIAAVPVVAMAYWLFRPRDRWYAVGEDGLALGERFFGEVRWDHALYKDIDGVTLELRRILNGLGEYVSTGYRYTFASGRRRRFVFEGQVRESEPRGTSIRLPADSELPQDHELRFARSAASAWAERTGRRVETAAGDRPRATSV